MNVTPSARWLLPGAVLMLLSACSSTKLVQSWQEPTFAGPPVQKVLVMGLFHDPLDRRFFEDEFAARISASGVQAVPSYTLIPNPDKGYEAARYFEVVSRVAVRTMPAS